ncbi:unnamed protein product [Bemisia tabaci]|uniref:Single-strand selective monofunctional uracil DNA glycosylase n=1 Tax=Bemisia tabaci TaxID=7038 RepID=A0A9P0G123_BEMTA|nr:unnamed protein product [Bemisia tabaci]
MVGDVTRWRTASPRPTPPPSSIPPKPRTLRQHKRFILCSAAEFLETLLRVSGANNAADSHDQFLIAQILHPNSIMASTKRKIGEKNGLENDSKKSKLEFDYAEKLIALENELVEKILTSGTDFKHDKNVAYTYNPLDYAAELHAQYVQRFCQGPKKILFLGMNPGPHGMTQTGVPFGEIPAVRDFLGIRGPVQQPKRSHPKLPVTGLNCSRSEPSGKRFWGLAKELSGGDPDVFFKNAIVYNYFPLSFITSAGRNITPVELNKGAQALIDKVGDEILSKVLKLFEVDTIVAIGAFAKKRSDAAIKQFKVPNVKNVYEILFYHGQ